jgi:hypothetical protein
MNKKLETPVKELKPRRPCNAANLAVVTGAVVIHTPDGSVVLTPNLARDIAAQLPSLANLSESAVLQHDADLLPGF